MLSDYKKKNPDKRWGFDLDLVGFFGNTAIDAILWKWNGNSDWQTEPNRTAVLVAQKKH